MTETQKRELEAFLEEQAAIGGLIPSKQKHGNIIWVDTDLYVFKITVDKSYGYPKYIVDSGSPMASNSYCVSVNSHYPQLKYDMKDYIGRGLRLFLVYANGTAIYSGTIMNASVSGEGYSYELWK